MSAVIRAASKFRCGVKSVLVMNKASEPWKIAGYFMDFVVAFGGA